MLCLWAVPYGLGAGAIDAALNNYVALHYNSRHMSWLHCFWGLGTIISPYVMSYALTTSVWQNGYRMGIFYPDRNNLDSFRDTADMEGE